MKFGTVISSGKEVLFVGHERGNSQPADAWLTRGRWKISMRAVVMNTSPEEFRINRLAVGSTGLFFCFEIADFEKWGAVFEASADYTSYRPSKKEIWSVGQLRWTDVKDLDTMDQIRALRGAVNSAIHRIGTKRESRKTSIILRFPQILMAF